jgi:hypothetical protein
MIKLVSCPCGTTVYCVPFISFNKKCPVCKSIISVSNDGQALSNGTPCLSTKHFLTELHYFYSETPKLGDKIWVITNKYQAVPIKWGLMYSEKYFDKDNLYKDYLLWIRR